jgi:hypothetical protein
MSKTEISVSHFSLVELDLRSRDTYCVILRDYMVQYPRRLLSAISEKFIVKFCVPSESKNFEPLLQLKTILIKFWIVEFHKQLSGHFNFNLNRKKVREGFMWGHNMFWPYLYVTADDFHHDYYW